MEISVVIPVYNKISIIKDCIELNIRHCSKPQQWIIIDNNSDEDTKKGLLELQKLATSIGHEFVIHHESSNTGVAKAWNKGRLFIKNEFLCILNNDCVMMPDWDKEMIRLGEKNRLDFWSPFIIETMIKEDYQLQDFISGKNNWKKIQQKNKNALRKGLFGGVVLFGKATSFNKVGKFDERFWLSLEEMDFLWRAHLLGYKLGAIGGVVGQHRSGSTRETVHFDHSENQKLFYEKWGWDFGKNETKFIHKIYKSFNKYCMILLLKLTPFNPFMPPKRFESDYYKQKATLLVVS